ncbi:MAG TPA: cellulase family glycosylhydrolase [Chloroflexota bacterium]|nr:cellulase family glycosylhydrolase [Chloroflexota bacterium]
MTSLPPYPRLTRRMLLAGAGLTVGLGTLGFTRPAPSIGGHFAGIKAQFAPTLNYLQTGGTRIVDSNGYPVVLTGLNWFGMETGTLCPHGLWARNYGDLLDQVVQGGFNCLRLPFSGDLFNPDLKPNGIDFNKNPDLEGRSGLEILDTIVVAAGKRGLKIILDQHRPDQNAQSPLWYTDHYAQADWLAQWQALAARYLGNDAVIGADLHNEPAGPATWGGGDPKTDWAIAAETAGNTIHAVNPNWLILVEGIEKILDKDGNPLDWTWQGGELMGAGSRLIQLNVPNRVVYSPHDYGPGVYGQKWFTDPTFPDNLPAFWDKHWGYLQKQSLAPLLVGEFGGRSVGDDTEGLWQRTLVSYLAANRMSYTYWCLNPNSGDTGGWLGDDWQTINPGKETLLKTFQGKPILNVAPTVVNAAAVPPPTGKAGSLTLPATATPSPTPLPASTRTYVVQPGDTLASIAARFYGNPDAWPRLVKANADQISDPDLVRPGQALRIP